MADLQFNPEEMRARGYDAQTIADAERAVRSRAAAYALIEKLEATFGAIPRPNITLSVARALDDEWLVSTDRAKELASEDPELDWRDVSDGAIKNHQEYFTFSDAEGCRFYLPAYMRQYLRDFPYSGYDAVYWACTEPKKLEALSISERECVDQFMSLCHEYQVQSL